MRCQGRDVGGTRQETLEARHWKGTLIMLDLAQSLSISLATPATSTLRRLEWYIAS